MPIGDSGTGSTTAAGTWYTWVMNSTTTTSTASTVVWDNWCTNTTTSTSSITSGDTWAYWHLTDGTIDNTPHYRNDYDERIEREHVAQLAEERKRSEEADRRAQELLVGALSEKQAEEFKKEKHFVVHGRSGHRYRIRHGRVANVDVIDKDGRITHRLCAHPKETVPNHDTMLAQKLYLEHQEEEFVKLANRHPYYGADGPVLPAMQ